MLVPKDTPLDVQNSSHLADALADERAHTTLVGLPQRGKDARRMHDSTEATKPRPLRCPLCEVSELRQRGPNPERCPSCEVLIGHEILETLRQITKLPDAVGRHACECGHPEMRRLPDGVQHCPACGSEVLPIGSLPSGPPDETRTDGKPEAIGERRAT